VFRRGIPDLQMFDGTDGYWLYPHGSFTPPHTYGATDNAMKRSIRKYHYPTRWVIAGQDASSCLP